MRPHRLNRLARLTRGAALVGLGLAAPACGKDPATPGEGPYINSPPEPKAHINAPETPPSAAPVASETPTPPAPVHVNATPTPTPTTSSPPAGTATPDGPKAPKHVNSPKPPTPPPPPPKK